MNKFILIITSLFFMTSCAMADEVISTMDDAGLSTLNEQLRQSSDGIRNIKGQLADILPVDLSSSSKVINILPIVSGGTGQDTAAEAINALMPSQAGHAGDFLTTDETTVYWTSVNVPPVYVADTTPFASADTERTHSNSTWTKVKEITVYGSGTIRVSFDLHTLASTARGKVYKNDSAIGTEQTTTSGTYVNFKEDFSGIVNGDKIQLYLKADPGTTYAQNFRLMGTTSVIDTD